MSNNDSQQIVNKAWNFAHVLSDDGRLEALLLDGWGILMSIRSGWVWNIWGRVVLHLKRGTLRICTDDDAKNLVRFIEQRIGT